MADITMTITADEDDLREFAKGFTSTFFGAQRISAAIAAALPKPRIAVKPGMVLQTKDEHRVRYAVRCAHGCDPDLVHLGGGRNLKAHPGGLDPDDWEVLLDAEDGAS